MVALTVCSCLAILIATTPAPRVEHIAPVAPAILSIEVQAGRIVPMRQIPYQKEPGDRIESSGASQPGEPREVRLIRGGRPVGFLIGRERNVLNLFERLEGAPLDTGAADRPVVLTPLPPSPQFTARLRWSALPWKVAAPGSADALDENGRVLRTVQLKKEGSDIVLQAEPDVFAYRLR